VMLVEPVLVTVEPPRTAKLSAVPNIDAADTKGGQSSAANAATTNKVMNFDFILDTLRSPKVCHFFLEIFLIDFSFL
jgi:hypothetical protein